MVFQKTMYFLLILYLVFFLQGCSDSSSGPETKSGLELVAKFEGGSLYVSQTGKFNVLELHGTFKQMGRQYGHLLKVHIDEVYTITIQKLLAEVEYNDIKTKAEEAHQLQPQQFKDLIEGMAETSGLGDTPDISLEKQINASQMMRQLMDIGCSTIAAFGDYTPDGSLIVGRNWDASTGLFDRMDKFLTITIFNPVDGNSVVDINYAGIITPQTVMNNKGLYLDLHDAKLSDPDIYADKTPASYQLFTFLMENSTLEELEAAINAAEADKSYIVSAVDINSAYSFLWPTYGIHKRSGINEGLLVTTNHFVNPPETWTEIPELPADPVDAFYTKERRDNLIARGAEYKGDIDLSKMMLILDKDLNTGSAKFVSDPNFSTYYQVIFTPGDMKLWLKTWGYSDWEELSLNPFFGE